MKKILFVFISILSIFMCCKISERRVYQKIYGIKDVYLNVSFAEKTNIDGKTFFDNSADLDKLLKNYEIVINGQSHDNSSDLTNDKKIDFIDNSSDQIIENTTDINTLDSDKKDNTEDINLEPIDYTLNIENYIIEPEKIKYYISKKQFLKEKLSKYLTENLKKEDINLLAIEEIVDNTKDTVIVDVKITDYYEGEFNLIRNIPTEICFKVNLLYNNRTTSYFKKWYKVDSLLENPTENLRLNVISNIISKEISNLINDTNDKKIKTDQSSKSNKNDKKQITENKDSSEDKK